MSTIKADTVQPKDFATDLTLGASGDTVTVAADSININKVQDKGGNTLWDYSTGVFVSPKKEFASQNLKLLTTQVASGSSSVSFITGIDSTYDVYIFKFLEIHPQTDSEYILFDASTDGGSTYGVVKTSSYFYTDHWESDAYSNLGYVSGSALQQSTAKQQLMRDIGNGADECGVGQMYLFAPSDTTYVKLYYSDCQIYEERNASDRSFVGGYLNTTSAINAIQFSFSTGTFSGTIKMYGLL